MLAERTSIFNIRDAEGFVRSSLPRVLMTADMRDELVAEGLRILTDMAARYQPGRNGQDPTTSSFSGYAGKFLPGKLRDAWHRLEGHTLTTNRDDGKREWQYPSKPVSIDATDSDSDGPQQQISALRARAHEPGVDETVQRVLAGLDELWRLEREQIAGVIAALAEGVENDTQLAQDLSIAPEEVVDCRRRIRAAIPYVAPLEEAA